MNKLQLKKYDIENSGELQKDNMQVVRNKFKLNKVDKLA